jgi:protein-tyrosine kinase
MDTRPGLIERAAALLRDDVGRAEPSPPMPITADHRREPSSPVSLSRTHILDHEALARSGIVMPWSTTQRVVEEFRIIKRNIVFRWQTPEYLKAVNGLPRVVMVTSSKPREGKTFASINLALAFAAEENLTTVLIDGDPSRGDVGNCLKLPRQPGLTDVLAGAVPLREALIQTDLPSLVVLPSGTYGAHVPELLSGRGPSAVFAELARRYREHVVIVDTAPCLASTGPAGLASMVDQIVFVIEAGQTQRPEIESALSLLNGCRNVSFVLNKAPESREHFGSYSYYEQPDSTVGKVESVDAG